MNNVPSILLDTETKMGVIKLTIFGSLSVEEKGMLKVCKCWTILISNSKGRELRGHMKGN